MYKEIVEKLAKSDDLCYCIKDYKELYELSEILLDEGYLSSSKEFFEKYKKGLDCLVLFYLDGRKDYTLLNYTCATGVGYKEHKLTETIINPTYDDLLPIFSDTEPKDIDEVDLDIAFEYDTVERPKHYNVFKKEVVYTIKDLLDNNDNYNSYESYCIGNSLKYIFRAGLKGDFCEDLEKARYYINKILEERKWKEI